MERGAAFLKAQIRTTVTQHRAFLDALVEHEKQAEDERYRALCSGFIPKAASHQQMLEAYQVEIGADTDSLAQVIGAAVTIARELADVSRESDYLRLIADIAESRRSEDTFRTFRDAGRSLGLRSLATLGDLAEQDHDTHAKEAAALAQAMFVELVRQGDISDLVFSPIFTSSENGPTGGNAQG